MGARGTIFLPVIVAFICGASSAQDFTKLAEKDVFWDRANKALFASHAVLEALDFGITHHNLSEGGRELDPAAKALCESGTPGQLVFFGGRMACVIAVSYLLHRTGHHKLERAFPVYADGDSAYGVAYSFAHR